VKQNDFYACETSVTVTATLNDLKKNNYVVLLLFCLTQRQTDHTGICAIPVHCTDKQHIKEQWGDVIGDGSPSPGQF
jgi:hypothetical protein